MDSYLIISKHLSIAANFLPTMILIGKFLPNFHPFFHLWSTVMLRVRDCPATVIVMVMDMLHCQPREYGTHGYGYSCDREAILHRHQASGWENTWYFRPGHHVYFGNF
jgi:hypothetical protein